MKLVFMGTPEFALPSLSALLSHPGSSVLSVYTKPDSESGRGMKLVPSPVKSLALKAGIPVETPSSFRKGESARLALEKLKALKPDLGVVVAYGHILPPEVLEIPKFGFVNVHGSLLPKYRGAAPIFRAMTAGEKELGVTLMHLDAGMDSGGMISKAAFSPEPFATYKEVHDRLALMGAELLSALASRLESGESLTFQPQDETQATYAPKLKREDRFLDLNLEAQEAARRICALDPRPGAKVCLENAETLGLPKQWSLRGVLGVREGREAPPGTALELKDGALWIAFKYGKHLGIRSLQPEGRSSMSAQSALSGYPKLLQARFIHCSSGNSHELS